MMCNFCFCVIHLSSAVSCNQRGTHHRTDKQEKTIETLFGKCFGRGKKSFSELMESALESLGNNCHSFSSHAFTVPIPFLFLLCLALRLTDLVFYCLKVLIHLSLVIQYSKPNGRNKLRGSGVEEITN